MSKPSAGTAYSEKESKVYDEKRFVSRGGKKIHEIESGLLKCGAGLASKKARMLEVGCGTGRFIEELCGSGFKVDGIDASPHMLAQCGEKIKTRFPDSKLALGEAARLPYPDNSYDFVYSIRLLNQTESPEYALNAVADMIRVVRPGGYILVEFMNYYRPRLLKQSLTGVRLRTRDVAAMAKQRGCELIWRRGAFFWGMTAFQIVPEFFIGLTSVADKAFSRLFPGLCSRCYVLLRKK